MSLGLSNSDTSPSSLLADRQFGDLSPQNLGFSSIEDNLLNAAGQHQNHPQQQPEGQHGSESTGYPVMASDHSPNPPGSTGRAFSSEFGAHNIEGADSVREGADFWRSVTEIPHVLPHDKVFNVQCGSQLFALSGASISSDAPSYFSSYFLRQVEQSRGDDRAIRTLHIDRDPEIFRDIARHLQGYYVSVRDPRHFVYLFADAQLFQLPKLISRLFDSEIFIDIGSKCFQIPRDLFSSPGDSPNYFSLGFHVFFTSPGEVFPGLNREGLLRPPAIAPPNVPNRSPEVFSQLLHLLRGYPVHIKNEEHRAELLRDCRYFHLRGLEQKLIPHSIAYNPVRDRNEITIRLEDVKPSGVSVSTEGQPGDAHTLGWVNYSRPFADEMARDIILEIGNQHTKVDWNTMRADFIGDTKKRIAALFQVIANKLNLQTTQPLGVKLMSGGSSSNRVASPGDSPLSEDKVKIEVDSDCFIKLDGEEFHHNETEGSPTNGNDNDDELYHKPSSEGTDAIPSGPAQNQSTSRSTSVGPATSPNNMLRPGPAIPSVASSKGSRAWQPGSAAGKRIRLGDTKAEWFVKKGHWLIRVQSNSDGSKGGLEVLLQAVMLDAWTSERGRNKERTFLS